MVPITIIQANLEDPLHGAAIVELVDSYAREPMGGGTPLTDDVRSALVPGLRAHPMARVFLAYEDETPVGIAVCFVGYSTFAAKPLINVHDSRSRPHIAAMVSAGSCSSTSPPRRVSSAAAR